MNNTLRGCNESQETLCFARGMKLVGWPRKSLGVALRSRAGSAGSVALRSRAGCSGRKKGKGWLHHPRSVEAQGPSPPRRLQART